MSPIMSWERHSRTIEMGMIWVKASNKIMSKAKHTVLQAVHMKGCHDFQNLTEQNAVT